MQYLTDPTGAAVAVTLSGPSAAASAGAAVLTTSPAVASGAPQAPVATEGSRGVARQLSFNVLDYGAQGNGVADDSGAIQAAINDAQAILGATVFLPQGTYLCTRSISITSPINMVGAGGWGIGDANAAKIKAAPNLNAHLVQFTTPATKGMVGACFRNLVFDGQGANQTAGDIFNATGAIHCLWDFCHFIKPWGNGLNLFQDGNGSVGHHNRVTNCLFDNGTVSNGGDGRGINIQASDENFIAFCDFETCGRTGAAQPNAIFDQSGLNHIIACTFVNGATGVKVQAGSGTRIIGCTFDGCKDHNIRLNGSRNTVQGNYHINIGTGSTSNTIDGVWDDGVSDNIIVGNYFLGDPGGGCRSGINLASGPATNALITDNKFTGTFTTNAINVGAGTGHHIAHNPGWNPRGSQTPPAIPATTVALANPFPYDMTFYLTGGTVTVVAIGGTATGLTSGAFRLAVGQTITLTYSVAPTWTCFAD